MAKRIKAEDYKVNDPDATMARFKTLLGKIVKVPKIKVQAKQRRGTRHTKQRVRSR